MQIHELTQPKKLDEGVGSFLKGLVSPAAQQDRQQNKINQQAAKAAGKLSQQGYGATGQSPSDNWQDKYKQIANDPNIAQYAKGIAQGWATNAASLVPSSQGAQGSAVSTQLLPILASAGKRNNNTLTTTQIGQLLAKGAPTIWKNTADKSTAIAQLSKQLSAQGITVSDKPQAQPQATAKPAATTVAPKARPKYGQPAPLKIGAPPASGLPTPAEQEKFQNLVNKKMNEAVSPANIQYHDAFKRWTDKQLATRVPDTGATITMNDVVAKFPDLAQKLDQQLAQVVQTKGTPQQAQAIEEYIKLASAGVQALAQTSKNKAGSVQQTNLGISPQQLASLKALARTPAGKDMLKQQLGL